MGTGGDGRRNHSMEADARWHLDKRVPIALIVTIAIQTAGVVWWAASAAERINNLEKRADATAPQSDRLTRVEVKLEGVEKGIQEIKQLITQKR